MQKACLSLTTALGEEQAHDEQEKHRHALSELVALGRVLGEFKPRGKFVVKTVEHEPMVPKVP